MQDIPNWLIFMLPAIVAFTVIAILIGILIFLRRRTPRTKLNTPGYRFEARLINLESKRDYRVDTVPWRIGRSRINSLSIDDHSVSRVHAEINIDDAAKFHLSDLESLNGVYVNEKKVEISPLTDGDIIDIGDVRFRFEVQPKSKGDD